MTAHASYKQVADASIRDLLLEYECQPILFIGSGLSKRYFGAPTWRELLEAVFSMMPNGTQRYEYTRQKLDDDPIAIGSELADQVFEWAWAEGRSEFPEEFYASTVSKDCFVKYLACRHLEELTPLVDDASAEYLSELAALAEIKPHAIITTNYDLFLEQVFEGYETITGQSIIRYNTNSFGEIYHIHGDVTEPSTIVLTKGDYDEWSKKKKYVSAKLLTYFAEHPVFIFGYGLGDENVKSIMRDIGELVADESGLIRNVYQVVWRSGELEENPPDQALFAVDGKEYRTKAIHTKDLKWVFSALKSQSALTSINPKLVRALAARMMKLIRHDIPSGSVEVNYDVLERVSDEQDHLPSLLGITSINNPNQSHPFTLTQLAGRIGLPNWQAANKLLHRIKDEKGVDLRSTDNRYHCRIKTGTRETSSTRKWSQQGADLLLDVLEGNEYEIDL
ncbi:SIR2 family protein [uncultured Tateyamaria sp.]|uniref:SIR2 family NAD-dependent protein deacylase n=1 Tax=uncultured Tateyamaria sp. TaxID=455651 RepID=UPI00262E519B|nr:SIR2 family protein [uncultured Tateyamaria sp.]